MVAVHLDALRAALKLHGLDVRAVQTHQRLEAALVGGVQPVLPPIVAGLALPTVGVHEIEPGCGEHLEVLGADGVHAHGEEGPAVDKGALVSAELDNRLAVARGAEGAEK